MRFYYHFIGTAFGAALGEALCTAFGAYKTLPGTLRTLNHELVRGALSGEHFDEYAAAEGQSQSQRYLSLAEA